MTRNPTGRVGDEFQIITPTNPAERGCQLSIQFHQRGRAFFEALGKAGIIADWREPDVIRLAPTPLYNSFEDVFRLAEALKQIARTSTLSTS